MRGRGKRWKAGPPERAGWRGGRPEVPVPMRRRVQRPAQAPRRGQKQGPRRAAGGSRREARDPSHAGPRSNRGATRRPGRQGWRGRTGGGGRRARPRGQRAAGCRGICPPDAGQRGSRAGRWAHCLPRGQACPAAPPLLPKGRCCSPGTGRRSVPRGVPQQCEAIVRPRQGPEWPDPRGTGQQLEGRGGAERTQQRRGGSRHARPTWQPRSDARSVPWGRGTAGEEPPGGAPAGGDSDSL